MSYCAYHNHALHVIHILHILQILHNLQILHIVLVRHILRTSQPVYGFWFYFMTNHGIVSSLQKSLPKLVLKSDADVDALLNYKLRI